MVYPLSLFGFKMRHIRGSMGRVSYFMNEHIHGCSKVCKQQIETQVEVQIYDQIQSPVSISNQLLLVQITIRIMEELK